MQTIEIGGQEYMLRCDLNAYEEILERFGSLEEAVRIGEDELENMRKLKFLAAVMINEHNAFTGTELRYTEADLGRMILPGERTEVYKKLLETINGAFAPKN